MFPWQKQGPFRPPGAPYAIQCHLLEAAAQINDIFTCQLKAESTRWKTTPYKFTGCNDFFRDISLAVYALKQVLSDLTIGISLVGRVNGRIPVQEFQGASLLYSFWASVCDQESHLLVAYLCVLSEVGRPRKDLQLRRVVQVSLSSSLLRLNRPYWIWLRKHPKEILECFSPCTSCRNVSTMCTHLDFLGPGRICFTLRVHADKIRWRIWSDLESGISQKCIRVTSSHVKIPHWHRFFFPPPRLI